MTLVDYFESSTRLGWVIGVGLVTGPTFLKTVIPRRTERAMLEGL